MAFYPWSEWYEFERTLDGKTKCKGKVHVAQDIGENEGWTMILHVNAGPFTRVINGIRKVVKRENRNRMIKQVYL